MALINKVIAENLRLLGRENIGGSEDGGDARPAEAGTGCRGGTPMGRPCFCPTP